MTRRRYRALGLGLLAGAGLVDLASMLNAARAFGDDGTALIMGYALTPTPDAPYESQVMDNFIDPSSPLFAGQPTFPGYSPVMQYTPETDYQQGLSQGVTDLNAGIEQYIEQGNVVVYGYSESTSVATQEMINLDNAGQPLPNDLSFVLVEDLNNPNGGFFERFPSIPSLSLPATPADSPYPTDIYTIEYSGTSDFPQYPSDLLADLNSMDGYVYLHPFLLPGYPTQFSLSELAGAVPEPTSQGYDGSTEYFMIPTQDLPMLDLLRATPGVGPAMADLIQPDLRVLVDLGYDWTGPANVATPAGVSPSIDWSTVDAELAAGAQQGITAAEVDLGMLPTSDLPNAYPYLPDVAGLESGSIALFDPSTAADAGSLSGTGLETGLTELFTNPLSLLSL